MVDGQRIIHHEIFPETDVNLHAIIANNSVSLLVIVASIFNFFSSASAVNAAISNTEYLYPIKF